MWRKRLSGPCARLGSLQAAKPDRQDGQAPGQQPHWHHSMLVLAHSPHLCCPQLGCHNAAQPCAAAKLQHAAAPDEGGVVHQVPAQWRVAQTQRWFTGTQSHGWAHLIMQAE